MHAAIMTDDAATDFALQDAACKEETDWDEESELKARALYMALVAVPGDNLVHATIRGLMRGYHQRWIGEQDRYEVLGVEQFVQSQLINPETGRTSRTFSNAGIIDVRAKRDGRRIIIDHKTTSSGIDDPDEAYWRQLVVESQASHYMLLEYQNGNKCDEAEWDVVRKPGIKPKKLSAKDLQAVVHSRQYMGSQITDADVKYLAENEGRESLWMYEIRLAADCMGERPDRYFQRRSVPRMDSELLEWAGELWGHGQDLLQARASQRWLRNSGACMNYGRPCEFLGICSGHDSPDSDRWQRKSFVHNELPVIGGTDGKDLLTNSRIRSFQTCRRKHFYQYEVGIERMDEDETETLYFGTQWHLAQAAWWGTFIQQGEK